jgi:hypothetical protein
VLADAESIQQERPMNWVEACRDRQLGELYFGAGALEFWMCDEAGNVTFYDPAGQLPKSKLCPSFPNKV